MSLAPLALVMAASQPRPLGWSYAQILAMGRERWRGVVERDGGHSRAAYANGEWDYGDAAAWRNDRFLARRGRALRAAARDLRAFVRSAVEVGDAVGGGGTFWSTVLCESHADVEAALGSVLLSRASPRLASSARIEGDLRWLLGRLDLVVARGWGDGGGRYARRGVPSARELQVSWALVERDSRRLTRRESSLLLWGCQSLLARVRNAIAE